jgi:pimeloyl-ACP methyl ester carboxylesterase
MLLAHLTIVASAVLGWPEISVQPSRGGARSAPQRGVAHLDRPTERTLETLARYDLARDYRRDVDRAIARLEAIARSGPNAEVVYALAELSWVEGRRLDRWRKAAALDRFVDAVAYAFDYLFDPRLADPQRTSDPRFQGARNLYNGGLEHLIRMALARGRIEPDGTIKLNVHGREQVLRVVMGRSPWQAQDIDKILVASDFEVTGLPTRSHLFGVGVPLIGVREAEKPGQPGPERFYPPEMAFPLTAYLVPNSRLDPNLDTDRPRECTLQLIDPVHDRVVGRATSMAVEADLTTPLAYMWSRTDLDRYRWTGLLRPGEALGRANLMLLRPYEPGKVPVVMVHGLWSSPLAWIPMLNELLGDEKLQGKCQFLLYMYPTGVPIPIAAAGLRQSLDELRRMYDADGRDPSFDDMVLLGHSMGGLLSHFMVVDSDDKLWRLNSDRPFDRIVGPKETLDELRGYLFFKHLPYVSRVVFLATPHRGSDLSRGLVGRVGAGLISEPDHINDLLSQLLKANPEDLDRRRFRRMPTSIETLAPHSPILEALLTMTPNPRVAFHSIIGSKYPTGALESTDGVVPYTSAHVDGVQSELLVRSDHGVQKSPEAILEVRRILAEHLGLSPSGAPAIASPAPSATAPVAR